MTTEDSTDPYADRHNATRLRADGKPTDYRRPGDAHALLACQVSSVHSAPDVVLYVADPDARGVAALDTSPQVMLDRTAAAALASALATWVAETAPVPAPRLAAVPVPSAAGVPCCCRGNMSGAGVQHGPRACAVLPSVAQAIRAAAQR